jgi:DNA-binding MarR family transcriptional regulator
VENKNMAGTETSTPALFRDVIGYHLRLAQEASFEAFSLAADKAGLKPGWYTILTVLAERDGLTPSELGALCGRDRSTLTFTLKGLAARGLIERERRTADQRSYVVRLTDEGRRVQQALAEVAHHHDQHLDAIVGKDKEQFLAILKTITAALSVG